MLAVVRCLEFSFHALTDSLGKIDLFELTQNLLSPVWTVTDVLTLRTERVLSLCGATWNGWREGAERTFVVHHGKSKLLDFVNALGTTCRFACCVHSWQQQQNENCNDGDHHQQLDECKTFTRSSFHLLFLSLKQWNK